MAQMVRLQLNPIPSLNRPDLSDRLGCRSRDPKSVFLLQSNILRCNGRFSCLFSDNRREEQARKALESALGGKKNEFDKWSEEIKKREESGGGKDGNRGGWFGGGGGWFGWSNGDHFWNEAQQTGLTVLAIVLMYLIVAKGEVMVAVVFNPLLYALRGTRDGLSSLASKVMGAKSSESDANSDKISNEEAHSHVSAKESVVRKWGSD